MAIPPSSRPLSGQRILICRPEPEASRLADGFRAKGATTEVVPLLERLPLPESAAQRSLIQHIDQYHHIIAVSPYAARLLVEQLDTWWPQPPVGLHWYGVGSGTAQVLGQAGLRPHWPEWGNDSEALLALPQLASPSGQKVLLVRGDQGRELIRDTLRQRGADVTALSLYSRRCPATAQTQLPQSLTHFDPHAVVVLSGETLNNFIALGENSDHTLRQRLLVLPVQRVADRAAAAGFCNLCIPDSLQDDHIVAAVARRLSPGTCNDVHQPD
ncbi:uroporphyrinogen-III synthase [Marinobacter sp. SS21]|uniref:uroporphyrinogen-III synthase n=1 Tax=Marinobacter sp. SS21 TaxID=2979460 RepID=UPI00232B078E|nr:uroporphyrinogen-III synthase [Marinobacter sp. SS21]MDC0661324.1 uroporphyrinogen-III synthase [Marinobacter sp. SS21]